MGKIPKPNYTQIPNMILGNLLKGNEVEPGLMATLEGSELKVLLAICRITFGYHRLERRASLTAIQHFTGLSRPGVVKAAKSLEEKGLIERLQDGGVTLWRILVNSDDHLEVVNSVNQSTELTRPVNSVNQTGKLSLPPSKKETRKKPKIKERAEKELSHTESSPPPPPIPENKKATKDHPAIQAFCSAAKSWPKKATYDLIASTVGDASEDLDFWKKVIVHYIACGWNPYGVKGMIEHFQRRELPTNQPSNNGGKPKNARNEPKLSFDPKTGKLIPVR